MTFRPTIEAAILNHLLKISTWTAPVDIYIALFAGVVTDGAPGTECSGGAYARVEQSAGAVDWTVAGSGPTTGDNDANIDFPTATADYSVGTGDPVQVCLFDAITVGTNLIFSTTFAAVDINNGDTPRINAGQCDVTQN